MPSGNSTDYDSLPSLPAGASHSAARPKKLYGRKAARLAPVRVQRAEEAGEKGAKRRRPARGEDRASVGSDSEDGIEEQEKARRKGREKRGPAKRGKAEASAKAVDEEGDVESNDETEVERTKRPPAKKASCAKTDRPPARSRSSQMKPAPSRWRADQALTDAENALAEKRRRKDAKKQIDVVVEVPARRVPSRIVQASSTTIPAEVPTAPTTLRKAALLDKSNLTADSPRSAARPAQPSQTSHFPLRPTASATRASRSGPALAVYRDETATTSKLASPKRALTLARTTAENLRLPRAAGGLRLGSEPPPSTRPLPSPTFATFDRLLPRSPRSASNVSPLRSLSPLRSAPLLGVPRAAQSTLLAPWALSAPASAATHTTPSSPQNPPADAPVFHFTTTEFGDLPSVRLSLGSNADVADGKEGGMDSTIVLETWEDGGKEARREESPMLDHEEEEAEGELTVRLGDAPDIEEANSTIVKPREVEDVVVGQKPADVAPECGDMSVEDGDATVMRVVDRLDRQDDGHIPEDAAVASPGQAGAEDVEVDESALQDQQKQQTADGAELEAKPAVRRSSRPLFWTSDFMPPRHPRPPVDQPLPDGPPSSEDELAYYLRTTGTFSSEDDLPPIGDAPSDESAREDWLAEREIGRSVKPTSGQRVKRIKASEAAREARHTLERLRIDEGRRAGLKREILPLDQVRVPKRVRRLIEQQAYERGAEADDELEDDGGVEEESLEAE